MALPRLTWLQSAIQHVQLTHLTRLGSLSVVLLAWAVDVTRADGRPMQRLKARESVQAVSDVIR